MVHTTFKLRMIFIIWLFNLSVFNDTSQGHYYVTFTTEILSGKMMRLDQTSLPDFMQKQNIKLKETTSDFDSSINMEEFQTESVPVPSSSEQIVCYLPNWKALI